MDERHELRRERSAGLLQFDFNSRTDLRQVTGRDGFESQHQCRLRVGGSDQTPPLFENSANSINGHELLEVKAGSARPAVRSGIPSEAGQHLLDEIKFQGIRAIHANFRVTDVDGRSATRLERVFLDFARISMRRHDA